MSKSEIFMGPGQNQAHCGRCKEVMDIPFPMPISAFGPWVKFAEAKHKNCVEQEKKETE